MGCLQIDLSRVEKIHDYERLLLPVLDLFRIDRAKTVVNTVDFPYLGINQSDDLFGLLRLVSTVDHL
jgi:hypothetical protein